MVTKNCGTFSLYLTSGVTVYAGAFNIHDKCWSQNQDHSGIWQFPTESWIHSFAHSLSHIFFIFFLGGVGWTETLQIDYCSIDRFNVLLQNDEIIAHKFFNISLLTCMIYILTWQMVMIMLLTASTFIKHIYTCIAKEWDCLVNVL